MRIRASHVEQRDLVSDSRSMFKLANFFLLLFVWPKLSVSQILKQIGNCFSPHRAHFLKDMSLQSNLFIKSDFAPVRIL